MTALIRGLAEAVASAPLRETEDLMSIDDGDDYDFLKSCWAEIERYQRRDGWIPSYHNTVSVASVYAKFCLDKADCVPKIRTEYLYLTQPGNHEDIRIAALSCIFDLGYGLSGPFLTYFFSHYVLENSPRIRARLMHILVKFVGSVAIGTYEDATKKTAEENDVQSLVIEQDNPTDIRKKEIARKETVEGALEGLKRDLSGNKPFMTGIWSAVLSSKITLEEFSDLLTLCSKLYDAQSSVKVAVKYPRWMVYDRFEKIQPETLGGKPKMLLTFKPGPIRTEKVPRRWQPYPTVKQAAPGKERKASVKPSADHRPKVIKISNKQNSAANAAGRKNSAKNLKIPAPPPVVAPIRDSGINGGRGSGIKLKIRVGSKPGTNGVNGTVKGA